VCVCRDAYCHPFRGSEGGQDCSDDHPLWICWNREWFRSFHRHSCPCSAWFVTCRLSWSPRFMATLFETHWMAPARTHAGHIPPPPFLAVGGKESSDGHTLWMCVDMGVLSSLSPPVMPCSHCSVWPAFWRFVVDGRHVRGFGHHLLHWESEVGRVYVRV
jgi:hypothetical protein